MVAGKTLGLFVNRGPFCALAAAADVDDAGDTGSEPDPGGNPELAAGLDHAKFWKRKRTNSIPGDFDLVFFLVI